MSRPAPAAHLTAAYITQAHGLKGQVTIKYQLANPLLLQGHALLTSQHGLNLTVLRVQPGKPGQAVLTLDGVTDRTVAEALRGVTLYLPRQALPEVPDEVYLHDLLGRPVHAPDGTPCGTVSRLQSTAAHDYLELTHPGAKPALIPIHADYLADLTASPLVLTELGHALTQL